MMSDVLVVEISGKRPGDKKARPTEKFDLSYDHVIVSNDATGYETDWQIVMVPEDYREWYCENHRLTDKAWQAPMNRSYAIEYAKSHGYRYLVQLDDNINNLQISYAIYGDYKGHDVCQKYQVYSSRDMLDDFISLLVKALQEMNAGISGCSLKSLEPGRFILRERYVYSLFALDLERCPDVFHGGFEDDIEFRYKLRQMGIPSVMLPFLSYGKTSQYKNGDESGNRAAYSSVGVDRGAEMRRLYGDDYSCGVTGKSASCAIKNERNNGEFFKHKLAPFSLGLLINDEEGLDEDIKALFAKYAKPVKESFTMKAI